MAESTPQAHPGDQPEDHRESTSAPALGLRVPLPSMEDTVHRNLIVDAQFEALMRERVLDEQRDPTSAVDWALWRTVATDRNLLRVYAATRPVPHMDWSGTEVFGGIATLFLLLATLGALLLAPVAIWLPLMACTLGLGAVTLTARRRNLPTVRQVAHADQQWIAAVRRCYHQAVTRALTDSGHTMRCTAKPVTAADIHDAFDALKQAWGTYTLDREALLLTMPALRMDSVPETRAYQDAMTALEDTLDTLTPDATADQLTAAAALADHTWQTWHTACDRAREIGLDNYTPTERAALTRLATLVERLAHPSTPTYERTAITRDIERQLARITTTPVAWSDLKALPELHAALPALPALPPTN